MKTLKPWIVLALVFVAGILVGVGGTRFAIRRVVERVANNPSLLQDRIERDLTRQLNLTPEQRTKVHAIVGRSRDDLRQLRDDFRPRLGRVLKRSEEEIRTALDEAQRQKFDRLLKRRPIVPPALRTVAAPN